ncbi:acyl-CoA synthetase [Rhodococcus sp. WS1]|uniref:class I adenylate-forming enzyme family protein n=1 Tax=unclassified Rhodococcus (in: high G+C Gram-positive bacteria) TaxID=192944 RepID=UPI0011411305|nr:MULTISPECIES: AMP-binding protein [unclassified Rhodococcus (in: high G+C Gram-positive bacteria)]ROZ52909.1 acyl-CoA synthetase [Rhodococcus sp. WS1]TQC36000.1 acyl-CoA synthetase [Rhodococcus sp. WS7]
MATLSPTATNAAAATVGVRYGELVERRARRQPNRTAFLFGDSSITYGELLGRISSAATRLVESGVQPGSRVACWSENRPEVLIALYASSRVGAIFTPIGIAAPPSDVAFILDDLAATTLLVSDQTARSVGDVAGIDRIEVVTLTTLTAALQGDSTLPLAEVPEVTPAPGSEALVVYTSGTSGHPKGVVLTHEALFANSINTLIGLDIVSDDVTLVNTPLSHVAALNTLAVNTLHKGGTVVIDSKFDPARCLDQIRDHKVTTMFAVPSMLTLLAREPGFETADISSVRWILGGGAPMPPALVAQWSSRGVPVLASYGLTEAGPSVSFRRTTDAADKPESSGAPAMLTDVVIVDSTGAELPAGTVGEIRVRGPHIAAGYWHNDNATAAAFDRGWLITGDRGLIDDDGDLRITGRSKDIIITGGENVDPAEVEHLLARYPDVADVAVIGRPDPVWGEIVVAVVVSDRPIELGDLQAFLRPHLAKYKIPRAVERRKALPRSPVGKLLRRVLTAPTEPVG